ncbi:MAG: hypothetical protein ACP5QG_06555 [candidate division WOR-3 bacterium]
MKKVPIFLVLAILSCARPQAPPRWTAPERLVSAVFRAREAAVLAYYIARTESSSEGWKILRSGIDELLAAIDSARADTIALVPRERTVYSRALYFLKDYARLLRDTSLVYRSVRFAGQAPWDPGLEEACAILCVLAFQHGTLDSLEKTFGRKFSQDERRAIRSRYGSIILGGPGPELGLWPYQDSVKPGRGPVLEAWAEDDSIAMLFPILELSGGRFLQPPDTASGSFYLYGHGGEMRGEARGERIKVTEGRFTPGVYYLALPSRAFWWDSLSPSHVDTDSLILACRNYLNSMGIKSDNVSISQVVPFWVWQDRPGSLVFGNATRGRGITVFYTVVEEGRVLYGETMSSRGEFYGVELVGIIDLDYDRVSEIVLSAEGEDSRFYIVLKKANGVWWKAFTSEPITEF